MNWFLTAEQRRRLEELTAAVVLVHREALLAEAGVVGAAAAAPGMRVKAGSVPVCPAAPSSDPPVFGLWHTHTDTHRHTHTQPQHKHTLNNHHKHRQ